MAAQGRATWKSGARFVLAAIGSAVGLGNILRFPFVAYKHGGSAFLVPYALACLLLGVPVLGLEIFAGSVTRLASPGASVALAGPRARGVGLAGALGALLLNAYYNALMAWAWRFLFASLFESLPWGNTAASAERFFYDDVLEICDDSTFAGGSLGGLNPALVAALALQYAIVVACCLRGVKTVGNVVLVTVPLPILLLVALLVRAATLEGASEGVREYILRFDAASLSERSTYTDAGAQIFFGIGIGLAVMPAYASKLASGPQGTVLFTWLIVLTNAMCSILAGFVVFCMLGHLAHQEGVAVGEVVQGGFSLAFVTVPVACSLMPWPGLWSALFFLSLIALGVDSAMSMLEAVVACVTDTCDAAARNVPLVTASVGAASFAFSLVFVTRCGYFAVDIVDSFVSTYILLLVGMVECIVFGWVRGGAERLADDVLQGGRRLAGSPAGDGLCSNPPGARRRKRAMWRRGTFWLPFAWPLLVRVVTPALILALILDFVSKHAESVYGGYAPWSVGVFGWGLCTGLSLLAFLVPALVPCNATVAPDQLLSSVELQRARR